MLRSARAAHRGGTRPSHGPGVQGEGDSCPGIGWVLDGSSRPQQRRRSREGEDTGWGTETTGTAGRMADEVR